MKVRHYISKQHPISQHMFFQHSGACGPASNSEGSRRVKYLAQALLILPLGIGNAESLVFFESRIPEDGETGLDSQSSSIGFSTKRTTLKEATRMQEYHPRSHLAISGPRTERTSGGKKATGTSEKKRQQQCT